MKICENCNECNLFKNQKPLFDKCKSADIMWVGLSAKIVKSDSDIPLSENTNSGFMISEIEKNIGDIKTYKTNIVKCPPLDKDGKLRYPTNKEIDFCINNFKQEIKTINPKIVFLLGKLVTKSVEKNFDVNFNKYSGYNYFYHPYDNVFFVPIHHPSYIYVYRKKDIDIWVESIINIIDELNCHTVN